MATYTVTELMSYKRCRLLWDLAFHKKLTPRMESNYFYVGRLVHQSIAEWTQNPDRSMEEIFPEILGAEVDALRQRYLDNVGARMSDQELDALMDTTRMPFEMLVNYQDYYKQPLPDGYELIQPEQTCMIEVPDTMHWECESCHHIFTQLNQNFQADIRPCGCGGKITWQPAYLEGTLDGLVIDTRTGKLYVLEHKTYEARPKLEVLENNEQFVAYSYIVYTLFPEYDLGGVLYNGLWKREKPPRGRTEDDLFFRHHLLKGEVEMQNYGTNLVATVNEILAGPAIYPTRIWQGCYDDKDFDKLCSAMMKGDDVEYITEEYYTTRLPRWFEADDDA